MNNSVLKISLRFILLLLTQVMIGNHMRIFDFVNPQWCILFVLWFPMKAERTAILWSSFFFGLALDIFSNSGGINTAAMLAIAYFRLPIFQNIVNDKELQLKVFNYYNYTTVTKLVMIFSIAFLHQFIVFGLSYFDFSHLWTILWKTLVSSFFTTFVTLVLLSIFSPSK